MKLPYKLPRKDAEVIDVVWKNEIGVVAVRYFDSKKNALYWQAYLGTCRIDGTETADVIKIADWGTKLTALEAAGFFPKIGGGDYKTVVQGIEPAVFVDASYSDSRIKLTHSESQTLKSIIKKVRGIEK